MKQQTSDNRQQTFSFSGLARFRSSGFRLSVGHVILFLLYAFCFFLFNSCKKEKTSYVNDYTLPDYEESSVRLVNMANYGFLARGNDTLVAAGKRTPYSPEGTSLPAVWNFPKDLLGQAGLRFWNGQDTLDIPAIPDQEATDVLALAPFGGEEPAFVTLPRNSSGPSRPDHIKIRIVNLMKAVPELPIPPTTGPLEDLVGPLTLTYADGTAVGNETTGVTVSQAASDYVEIPYGTYQFRILTADGRQVPFVTKKIGNSAIGTRIFDSETSRTMVPLTANEVTGITYAPVWTYQPGGVYTIFVSPLPFQYPIPGRPVDYEEAFQNQCYILEDKVVDNNREYGKVQAINAFPGISVNFRINGEPLASDVAFGSATDYQILAAGAYTLDVLDTDDNLLATVSYNLDAGQNQSVWLWPSKDNIPQLLLVANDLSSEYYTDYREDDGTDNRTAVDMTTSVRFLNLCPDESYISFTTDNGEDIREYSQRRLMQGGIALHADEAMYNMEPGKPATDLPYTHWSLDYNIPFRLMTYRSKPGVIPGRWATDIPAISSFYFVANPDLYIGVNRSVPTMEGGIYTTALIGRTGDGVSNARKARIVIIKHSK